MAGLEFQFLSAAANVREVKFYGRFSPRAMYECVACIEGLSGDASVLYNMEHVDFDVPSSWLISAGRSHAFAMGDRPLRLAILVANTLGFGMMRVFTAMLRDEGDNVHIAMDRSEALAWFGIEPDRSPVSGDPERNSPRSTVGRMRPGRHEALQL